MIPPPTLGTTDLKRLKVTTDVENDVHGFIFDFKPVLWWNAKVFQIDQLALFICNSWELVFRQQLGRVVNSFTLNRATLSLSVLLIADTLLLSLAMMWELDLILTELDEPWREFICIGRTISSVLKRTLLGPLMACCFLNCHLEHSPWNGYE